MSTALELVASNVGATTEEVAEVIKGMIISSKNQHGASATNAEMAIVTSVCAKYGLNPLVKECAAFVSGGKLQMVVMIDGFYKVVNRQPEFDGVTFEDNFDEKGDLVSITCSMHLKNRKHPVTVTEYLRECKDAKSSVWSKWPSRMLRHKSYIQCARMAFGLTEMVDPDEADRIKASERDVTPQQSRGVVDYQALEAEMSACDTQDKLRACCTAIREDMEKRGIWNAEKAIVIEMNGRHKARIEAAAPIEAEFEEVKEESANEPAKQTTDSAGEPIDGETTTVEFE